MTRNSSSLDWSRFSVNPRSYAGDPEYSYVSKAANICHKVAMQFPDGSKLPKLEIKARLQMIYDDLGLKKKAKATDIANYGFSVKDVKIPTNDGRVNGFELRKVG